MINLKKANQRSESTFHINILFGITMICLATIFNSCRKSSNNNEADKFPERLAGSIVILDDKFWSSPSNDFPVSEMRVGYQATAQLSFIKKSSIDGHIKYVLDDQDLNLSVTPEEYAQTTKTIDKQNETQTSDYEVTKYHNFSWIEHFIDSNPDGATLEINTNTKEYWLFFTPEITMDLKATFTDKNGTDIQEIPNFKIPFEFQLFQPSDPNATRPKYSDPNSLVGQRSLEVTNEYLGNDGFKTSLTHTLIVKWGFHKQ